MQAAGLRHNEGVTRELESVDIRFFTVLIAGFALLIALLGASAWVGIDAIRLTANTTNRLVEEQRATLKRVGDIQQQQDTLTSIFYSLAVDQSRPTRAAALEKLNRLEPAIRATLSAGLASARPRNWSDVSAAASAFIAEGRAVVESTAPPGVVFFRAHEALIAALDRLATSNFDADAAAEKLEAEETGKRVRSSLLLLGAALLIALAGSLVTIWTVSRMYRQLQWQRSELAQLSSRTMADQEETARRFSRELHDEFGQALSAIEASLVPMHHARRYDDSRMEDALALTKTAISNARDLSQLLRPSILDDFGLDTSLRWLAEGFSQRTGIQVDYTATSFPRAGGETETQLFRIAQEALTNVARHANATLVRMELKHSAEFLTLIVTDNGRGFSGANPGRGLGLVGMRARTRSADGTLEVSSDPGRGVTVRAEVRLQRNAHAA